MTLELNNNEKNILLQILDIATKAGGLQVAEACLHFAKKLSDKEEGQVIEEDSDLKKDS